MPQPRKGGGQKGVLKLEGKLLVTVQDIEYVIQSEPHPTGDVTQEGKIAYEAKAETIDGHPALVYWTVAEGEKLELDKPVFADLV